MTISNIRIKPVTTKEGKDLVATATAIIDNAIHIRNLCILRSNKEPGGLWVAMASTKSPNGTFREPYHPLNTETRNEVCAAVLSAYETYLADPEAAEAIDYRANGESTLNITNTTVYLPKDQSGTSDRLAGISMEIDSCFLLHRMAIIKRRDSDEIYLGMARRELRDGKYIEIFHPINAEVRAVMTEKAIEAYEKAKLAARDSDE